MAGDRNFSFYTDKIRHIENTGLGILVVCSLDKGQELRLAKEIFCMFEDGSADVARRSLSSYVDRDLFRLTNAHLALYRAIKKRGMTDGCSDLDATERSLLTAEQWKAMSYEFYSPEEFKGLTNHVLPDWAIVDFIDKILLETYSRSYDLT